MLLICHFYRIPTINTTNITISTRTLTIITTTTTFTTTTAKCSQSLHHILLDLSPEENETLLFFLENSLLNVLQRSRESVWLFVPTTPIELLNSSLHSEYFHHAKHTFWWYESLFFAVKTRLDQRSLVFKDVLFHSEGQLGSNTVPDYPDNQVVSGVSVWAYVTAVDGIVLQVIPLVSTFSIYPLLLIQHSYFPLITSMHSPLSTIYPLLLTFSHYPLYLDPTHLTATKSAIIGRSMGQCPYGMVPHRCYDPCCIHDQRGVCRRERCWWC